MFVRENNVVQILSTLQQLRSQTADLLTSLCSLKDCCCCFDSSVCSEGDLKEVVGRLRDWFRVLHENGNHKRLKLQKPEKNSESFRTFSS